MPRWCMEMCIRDRLKPIISGWDFNVAPYMSEMEFQIDYEKKEIYLLEENLGKPEAKEKNTCLLYTSGWYE